MGITKTIKNIGDEHDEKLESIATTLIDKINSNQNVLL